MSYAIEIAQNALAICLIGAALWLSADTKQIGWRRMLVRLAAAATIMTAIKLIAVWMRG